MGNESLQVLQRTYPKAAAEMMTADNTVIMKYYNPEIRNRSGEPKEYCRALLTKIVDGKTLYFDYRMDSDPKRGSSWTELNRWMKRIGLPEGYKFKMVSVSDMKITKIEPGMGDFNKTVPAQAARSKKWKGRITKIAPAGPYGEYFQGMGAPHPLLISYLKEQKSLDLNIGPKEITKHYAKRRNAEVKRGFEGIFERMSEPVEGKEKAIDIVGRYAKKYGAPLNAALSLFTVESGFVKQAVSPSYCRGLGQLSTNTALSVENKDGKRIFSGKAGIKSEIFEVEKNIEASIAYFSQMLKHFNGDIARSFEAYNTGPYGKRNADYRQRALSFLKFYESIGIGNLREMDVQAFMKTQEYKAGIEKLEKNMHKPGYFLS